MNNNPYRRPNSATWSHQSQILPTKRKFIYVDDEQHHHEEQTQTPPLQRRTFQQNASTSYHVNPPRVSTTTGRFHRTWSFSPHDCSSLTDRLVLVSYNLLGVENASQHSYLYFNTPYKYMDWNYRKTVICKELAQYDPSILCFQEVDRFIDLHDILVKDGFKGVHKVRTGNTCDGCAIFWKDERFTLLHEEHIEFQSFGLRNNVAQFCVLKAAATNQSLVVGNIHVLFNPKRGDIKLGQIRLFLEKAHHLSEEWGGIPVVLAGDYNSAPQSALYQYVSSGKLDILQHDRRSISGQVEREPYRSTFYPIINESLRWNDEELKLATGSEGVTSLQHNLKLQSAYLGIPGNFMTRDNFGEPVATSCHSNFTGTVDYIWHCQGLVPVRVLEALPWNALRTMGGLPSENWGSDHVALVCELAFANGRP